MLDTLIVFGLLGAIAVLVLHVLPRQAGGEPLPGERSIFPD